MATLEEIKALLGEPRFNWSDPTPWVLLEQELGVLLPAEFREITDAYGPVAINQKLHLDHPGHPIRNLAEEIKKSIEFWLEEDLAELLPSRAGSRPGELLPIATGTTAEHIFLQVPYGPSAPWAVAVQEMDSGEFVLYDMTFGDWLLAYLKGEDVMAGSSTPVHPFYEPLTQGCCRVQILGRGGGCGARRRPRVSGVQPGSRPGSCRGEWQVRAIP